MANGQCMVMGESTYETKAKGARGRGLVHGVCVDQYICTVRQKKKWCTRRPAVQARCMTCR